MDLAWQYPKSIPREAARSHASNLLSHSATHGLDDTVAIPEWTIARIPGSSVTRLP